MYQQLRDKIGTAGLIVGILALIVALGSGAYAASGGGGGKATASAKAKKGPRGPKGPKGDPGAPGPQGAQGPAGAGGKDGANGGNGTNGANGLSVALSDADEVTECADVGGVMVEVATKSETAKEVCNGKAGEKGEKGEKGDPWTAGGTLPAGATETGNWSFNGSSATPNPTLFAAISFPVPISDALFSGPNAESQSHFQTQLDFSDFCEGNVSAPTAPPGELCVYAETGLGKGISNAEFLGIGNAESASSFVPRSSGAVIRFKFTGSAGQGAYGFGSFAMTGCDPATDGEPDSCPE